jgi:hypothetical protein
MSSLQRNSWEWFLLITGCLVTGIAVLLILILNNFKLGRRFVDWCLQLH